MKLKGNGYGDQGVGGSPAASPCVKFSGTVLSSSCGQGSSVELGSQMGLDKDQDENDTRRGSGREATSFPDVRMGPKPGTRGCKIRSDNSEPPLQGQPLPGKDLLSGSGSSMMCCCSLSSPCIHQAKSSWELQVY